MANLYGENLHQNFVKVFWRSMWR